MLLSFGPSQHKYWVSGKVLSWMSQDGDLEQPSKIFSSIGIQNQFNLPK